MFQGSASLGKTEHFTYVQGNGGTLNGSTHVDYTNYYEVMPSAATELALFLEADRMRSVAVTAGEPRQPDRGRAERDPRQRPQPAVRRLPVADDPAGAVRRLRQQPQRLRRLRRPRELDARGRAGLLRPLLRAGQRRAHRRRRHRRRAGHAAGSSSTSATSRRGRVPERPSFAEPAADASSAPSSTTGSPRRPPSRWPGACRTRPTSTTYLPYVVLAEVLTDGDASRLQERMLLRGPHAPRSISGYLGLLGDPLDARDPTPFLLEVHHPAETSRRHRRRDRRRGARAAGRRRPRAARARPHRRPHDRALPARGRPGARPGHTMSVFEQQRGRAELVNELPDLLRRVTPSRSRRPPPP